MFLCSRLTVFWQALWCLKEVGRKKQKLFIMFHLGLFSFYFNVSFYFSLLSHITSGRQ